MQVALDVSLNSYKIALRSKMLLLLSLRRQANKFIEVSAHCYKELEKSRVKFQACHSITVWT